MQKIFLVLAIFNFGTTACRSTSDIGKPNSVSNVVQEKSKDELKQTGAVFYSQPEKSVNEFYDWYLKEKSPDKEKLKDVVSAKLSRQISKMSKTAESEFFTRIPSDKTYSEVWVLKTKLLKENENSAQVEVELIGESKNAVTHLVPIYVSVVGENEMWKIDSVEKKDY